MTKRPKSTSTDLAAWLLPALLIAVLLGLWQVVSDMGIVPKFLLPSVTDVAKAFVADFPLLLTHSRITLTEAAAGMALSVLFSIGIALLMDRFDSVRKALYPLLVLSQTIPPVAIAPLLVLWLDYGMAPKIALVVIVCFFPLTVSLLEGLRAADPDMISLLQVMGASRWQIMKHVKGPYALSYFFSGLRISLSYAVVGAVIAEWLGGYGGLGVYMTRVKKSYAFDRMFAVIFLISALSLLLMELVRWAEKKTMPWKQIEKDSSPISS